MEINLQKHFEKFRNNTIGHNATFKTPYGEKQMLYADWIASGRLYAPIEEKIKNLFGPMIGNTHSEASETGVSMTYAYRYAQRLIKKHVNASADDVIITAGSGMTRVVNKLQRILGLKLPDTQSYFSYKTGINFDDCVDNLGNNKPVVFITHIEHHSNHTSWLETIADVVVIPPASDLTVSPENLQKELEKYKDRKIKIGAFSAGSNVTGYIPPYYELCKIMHRYGGVCFVDFAASAPYIDIDMHPADPLKKLDAIYFSPHKFLGGPGSAAVLVFDKKLYHNLVPDHPGGGTVKWTNPWNQRSYIDDIEIREDGGTPAFLQTIRSALAIKLKEQMNTFYIKKREEQLLEKAFRELTKIPGLKILADNITDRLGVISFYIEGLHHNLIVKLLNDRYGIQVRGGCSCAGTYGHFLLNIDKNKSEKFTSEIDYGNLKNKPGWVRISIHPTLSDEQLQFIIDAVREIAINYEDWKQDYIQSAETGEWFHKTYRKDEGYIQNWFVLD